MADFFTYYVDDEFPGAVWRYESGKNDGDFGLFTAGELRWTPSAVTREDHKADGSVVLAAKDLKDWLMKAVAQ